MIHRYVLFYFVSIATVVIANYVNDWDEPFDFSCPAGQYIHYISLISSIHSDYYEDRRWEFLCRTAPSLVGSCVSSGYANYFDNPVIFMCSGNKVITGMFSYHDNYYEDRRFGFHCCDITGRVPANCYTTNYVNNWDRKLTLVVPEGQVIKGAFSQHNNYYEDRVWQFQLCTI